MFIIMNLLLAYLSLTSNFLFYELLEVGTVPCGRHAKVFIALIHNIVYCQVICH